MDEEIVVVGAGGHGKSVVSVLLAAGRRVLGVLDDAADLHGTLVQGVPVLGPISELARFAERPAVLGLGSNVQRRAVVARFPGVRWDRAIYPGAYVNPSARIGAGTVVFPGAVIGADARIGEHAIVSGNCTVGHDTVIGDYAQVAPGVQVAGGAWVEEGVLLGIGSIVCPGVRIGAQAVLGAGAVAVRDLPGGCLAFGCPARPQPSAPDAGE